jgi:urea transporter
MLHAAVPLVAGLTTSLVRSSNVVSFDPGDTSSLPGASTLSSLANGIGTFALIAAMVGVIIGAVMWAFGHYSQNYQQALNGRKGVLVSALAAILIGAAPFLINFFLGVGQAVKAS